MRYLINFHSYINNALCTQDKHIWHIGDMKKVWGRTGKIIIKIE